MRAVSLSDGLDHLEKMTEDELRSLLRGVFYKVEVLGHIMKIDIVAVGALKRVMRYVLSLNILLVESASSAEDDIESTKMVLSKIKSADANKLEEVLYLVRDIAREYYMKTGIA